MRRLGRRLAIGSLGALFLSGLALSAAPDRSGEPLPLESLRKLASLNPKSTRVQFLLGVRCESENRLSEARDAYAALVRLDPADTASRYNLGNVLFKLGDFPGAEAAYEEALRLDPAHLSARNNLGHALFKQGRYEEARGTYETVLARDAGRASTHRNLAEVLFRLGRPCQALQHLEQGSSLDPRILGDQAFSDLIDNLRMRCNRALIPQTQHPSSDGISPFGTGDSVLQNSSPN